MRGSSAIRRLPRRRVREHGLILAALGAALAALAVLASDDDREAGVAAPRGGRADLARVTVLVPGGVGGAVVGARVTLTPGEDDTSGGDEPGRGPPGVVIDGRARRAGGAGGAGDREAADDEAADDEVDPDGVRRPRRRGGAAGPPGATAVGTATTGDAAPEEEDGPPQGTGLLGEYYDHTTELRRIPRLAGITATLTRVDPLVAFGDDASFALPFHPETFAVAWTGWFLAECDGRHVFQVGSDDGSRLEVDNVVVVENDGLHGHVERTGEVDLAAGFHVVRLTFFENFGGASCVLAMIAPGGQLEPVPTRLLFPATAAPRDLPLVTAVTPDRARARERVTLTGAGFSDIPTYSRVRVGEAEAFVVEAAPDRLVIEVPEGTDAGPIIVDVGGVVSPAVPFTVDGTFGLHGRYVDLHEAVRDFVPVPPGARVDHERLDVMDLRRDGAFRLPFDPDTFAVTWTGTFFALRGGRHTFFLTCDDGGRLWIDGEAVIDHGGLHGPTTRSGEAILGWGRHDVAIEFFENGGGCAMVLDVQEDGGERRVVPRGRLEPPEAVRLRAPPRVTALDPPSVAVGDVVRLEGEGLTDPVLGEPIVTIGRRRLEVLNATWGSVLVRVPVGTDSGPVVLRVGPLESEPLHLEVVGFGALARYYDLEGELDRIPDLDALTPTLSRVDATIDFGEDAAFMLPFEDTFAVRWRALFTAEREGLYRFIVGSDDGNRLSVAGRRVLDDSGLHGYQEREVEVWLLPGTVPLELEYFENHGSAAARLFYVPPGGQRAVIPRLLLQPDVR